jgi:hypothetical protein
LTASATPVNSNRAAHPKDKSMASTKNAPVGQNGDSAYVAFGDDCQFGDICGYAFVVARRSRIQRVIRQLDAIKAHYKFPPGVPLHCRVLFNGDLREKAGLGHLTRKDAEDIVTRCLLLMNNEAIHVRFSSGSLQQVKETLGDTMTMWDHVKNEELQVPLNHDPKGLISWLAQMCLIVPAPDRRFARAEDWEVVISQDTTKVKWLGTGSRQAHNLINAFSSINAPEGDFHQFTPRISNEATHSLLQLADVAVYAFCHALDASEKGAFWRTLPPIRLRHNVPYPVCPFSEGPPVIPVRRHHLNGRNNVSKSVGIAQVRRQRGFVVLGMKNHDGRSFPKLGHDNSTDFCGLPAGGLTLDRSRVCHGHATARNRCDRNANAANCNTVVDAAADNRAVS